MYSEHPTKNNSQPVSSSQSPLYQAYSSKTEINGAIILEITDGLGAFCHMGHNFLEKHNLTDIQPEGWYPQQDFLNALKEIEENTGPTALSQIGKNLSRSINISAKTGTIEAALDTLNELFQNTHRGGYVGEYKFHQEEQNQYRVICQHSYPCDMDMGLIRDLVCRYGKGGLTKVIHETTCKKNGSAYCQLLIC